MFKLSQRIDQHESDTNHNFNKLVEAQRINTDAIAGLTASIASLVEDTRAIIQFHKDFQGTVRIGKSVQNFMVWLLKWGMIGSGIVAIINWLVKNFGN